MRTYIHYDILYGLTCKNGFSLSKYILLKHCWRKRFDVDLIHLTIQNKGNNPELLTRCVLEDSHFKNESNYLETLHNLRIGTYTI